MLLNEVKNARHPRRFAWRHWLQQVAMFIAALALVFPLGFGITTTANWLFYPSPLSFVSPVSASKAEEIDPVEKALAVFRMGYEYSQEATKRYGLPVAPDSASHRQLTDEMTIDGEDLGSYQRRHGLVAGNNSFGRLVYGDET